MKTICLYLASAFAAFALCGAVAAYAASPAPQTSGQPTEKDLLAQAQAESAAGHNQTARDLLSRAVALAPNDMVAQKALGDVEYRLEHYAAALAAYKIVLAHDPSNKDVHNRLGGVYAAQDNLDAAINEFRNSLPLSEGFANLVQSYADAGKLGDLESEYYRAEEHEPYEYITHYNLGYIYYSEKKYDLARAQYLEALDRFPRYNDARNALGMVYGDLGQYGRAIDNYKTVIAQDPKYYLAWMNWGVELIKLGQYADAITKLNTAINLDPTYARSYDNLGVVYDYLGDFTKAVELYEKALQLDPREREAYQNLGSLYYSHNLLNLAEAAFIKGLAVAPHFVGLHYNLAVVYQEQHKYTLAAQQYKAVLAIAPDNAEARAQLATIEPKLAH